MSSKTSFVLKQSKLEPKLVSAISETRHLFQLFCINIETGSFCVSKQPKQTKDQPETAANLLNINLYYSPYHKFCLFRMFQYRSETSKQIENFFWFPEKANWQPTEYIEFRFVLVRTKRKIKSFEDPLIENAFWRFFRFVSTKFCLFRFFRYRSKTPKQTEKKCF